MVIDMFSCIFNALDHELISLNYACNLDKATIARRLKDGMREQCVH